jgi:hypothetical protein
MTLWLLRTETSDDLALDGSGEVKSDVGLLAALNSRRESSSVISRKYRQVS